MTNKEYNEQTPEDYERRLRQLILYVAQICSAVQYFGATMLNKILWFADTKSYANTGKSISGTKYIKLPYGPVPQNMATVMQGMIAAHEIAEVQTNIVGSYQKSWFR